VQVYADAKTFLENYEGQFDVIINDLCDPTEAGPAVALYTERFYRDVLSKRLAPGGFFVTQSGPAGLLSYTDVFSPLHNTLERVFPTIVSYATHVPAFSDVYGFHMCSLDRPRSAFELSVEEINQRLRARLGEEGLKASRFYDGVTHQNLIHLPRYLRDGLEKETNIITEDNPRYIY
jgi:thermospermine synthase